MNTQRLLVAEDDEICAAQILSLLESRGYHADHVMDGEAALSRLQTDQYYDALLLDWDMPRLNGIGLLARLKDTPLAQIPAIMVTAKEGAEFVKEGMSAGAYFYLTKPVVPELLLSVVEAAVTIGLARRKNVADDRELDANLALITEARFEFRSLDEAHRLSRYVARLCPRPERVLTGLLELTANAVEHGNLGLDYTQKKLLLLKDRYFQTLAERLADPRWASRRARLDLQRGVDTWRITIADEGGGFDWRPYLNFDPERAFDPNGRGIAMARLMSFDDVEYKGNGNVVVATLNLPAQD